MKDTFNLCEAGFSASTLTRTSHHRHNADADLLCQTLQRPAKLENKLSSVIFWKIVIFHENVLSMLTCYFKANEGRLPGGSVS